MTRFGLEMTRPVKAVPVGHLCHHLMGITAAYFSWIRMNCVNLFNTLRPRQNGHHFADDTFKRIFLDENVRVSLKFVLKGPIDNIPALVQIMAWRRSGTSHYLNQWWLIRWRIYASLGLNELKAGMWVPMMTLWHEHAFCVTGLLGMKSTGQRWMPSHTASNTEFYFFLLWKAVEQTLKLRVI